MVKDDCSSDENGDSQAELSSWPPILWLVLGTCAGVATAIAAVVKNQVLATVFGAITAMFAIVLTFVVAHRQAKESKELFKVVTRSESLLLSLRESEAALDYGVNAPDEDDPDANMVDNAADFQAANGGQQPPSYSNDALSKLAERGSSITAANAIWRRKAPAPGTPGNPGWFVESQDGTKPERWFVRKAHGWTIRKAMPRDYLEELERQVSVQPQQIKLDYQLRPHGLGAWYARTYDGNLWKVVRPNRVAGSGIRVTQVSDDE